MRTRSPAIVAKIIFPVHDMDEAIAFYRSLGFDVESYDGSYAWVRHSGHEILHLSLIEELDTGANHSAGYFHVDDADAWHARWSGSSAEIGDPADRPWQMREFALRDPSNNLLRVGHNL